MYLNLNHIKQDSCEVLDKFENKNDVKKIGVFGSFARGDYTEDSDIDLIIDYNYAKMNTIDDLAKFLNLITDLRTVFKEKYNKETDVVEYKAL
jgi:predicted nucleotidyltransferase